MKRRLGISHRLSHSATLGLILYGLGMLNGACASSRTRFKEAVEDFTRSMRWGDWERTRADQYNAAPLPDSRELRVSDVALGEVTPQRNDTAIVTVAIEWYWLNQGTIQRSVVRQLWQYRDGVWQVHAQRLLQGPPLPPLPDLPHELPHGGLHPRPPSGWR